MKSTQRHRIPIQVPPERLLDALRTISVYDAPPGMRSARHFLDYAHATSMRVDLCWALLDPATDRLGPACIVLPNRGRTGMIFVTPPQNQEQIDALASLIDHAHGQLEPAEVVLAQGLCRHDDAGTMAAFRKAGFTHLAQLDYLQAALRSVRKLPSPQPDAQVTFADYDQANHDEIKQILDDSYVDTRDCPGLCGLRSIDDILADHIGIGVSDPALWITARIDGRGAAILMLNPLPDGRVVELSYIGVAHWARRRHLARRLIDIGFARLAQRSFESVVLAVDHANEPARRLYDALGFHTTDRRAALIRPVGPSSESSGPNASARNQDASAQPVSNS